MYRLKSRDIYASEIAEYLNLELHGTDFVIKTPGTSDEIKTNTLLYFDNPGLLDACKVANVEKLLLIIPEALSSRIDTSNHSYLVSSKPLLDFIRTINEFFILSDSIGISPKASISPEAILHRNVSVGENVVIGPEVIIGENTRIFNNVVIRGRVVIGKNCIIKDNATIGSVGYNFISDENGLPIQCPNIGKIIIKNNVWVGSNSCIENASFGITEIEDFVKIDDLVQIGYSSFIGQKSLITAGVIVSRNVKIGENCIVSPNSTIIENLIVGNNSIIGSGSTVVNDVEENSVYVGNPARFLKKIL